MWNLGQFVILRRVLKYFFIRMKCATSYSKKSIKLYWSQIRQIYQGKKIREKRICQSQQQRPRVTPLPLLLHLKGAEAGDWRWYKLRFCLIWTGRVQWYIVVEVLKFFNAVDLIWCVHQFIACYLFKQVCIRICYVCVNWIIRKIFCV